MLVDRQMVVQERPKIDILPCVPLSNSETTRHLGEKVDRDRYGRFQNINVDKRKHDESTKGAFE